MSLDKHQKTTLLREKREQNDSIKVIVIQRKRKTTFDQNQISRENSFSFRHRRKCVWTGSESVFDHHHQVICQYTLSTFIEISFLLLIETRHNKLRRRKGKSQGTQSLEEFLD